MSGNHTTNDTHRLPNASYRLWRRRRLQATRWRRGCGRSCLARREKVVRARRPIPLGTVISGCWSLTLRFHGTGWDSLSVRESTVKNCRPVVYRIDRTSIPNSYTDQETYQTDSPAWYSA